MTDGLIGGKRFLMVMSVAAICVIAAFAGGYMLGSMSTDDGGDFFTIVDDYSRVVALDGFPERIISAAPTPTEILFAVGAGNLVVGVDSYSDYPADTLNITKIGDYELDVETIIALEPDLILSSDLVPFSQLDTLQSHGIPYVILAAQTLEDVYRDIRLVGSITNNSDNANALVASLQQRVDAVTSLTLAANVSRPSVYLEYWPYWTFGNGSFGNDLIYLAGGHNIARNESAEYLSLSAEDIVISNPEIIIYTVGPAMGTTEDEIRSRPGWNQIDAIQSDKVFSIDDNLISRYGPRIVDGLEELAMLIHPELFE